MTVQDVDSTSINSWDSENPAGLELVFVNMNVKVVVCDCGNTYKMSPDMARKFYERGKKDVKMPKLTHQNDKTIPIHHQRY